MHEDVFFLQTSVLFLYQKFSERFSFSFAKIMLVFCILLSFGENLWKWEEQAQAILRSCEGQVWLWFSMMVFAHQWANSVSICCWYNCIVKGIVATIREEIHGKEMLVTALIVCLILVFFFLGRQWMCIMMYTPV